MGEDRKVYRARIEMPEEKRSPEDRGVDERIESEMILSRLTGRV
jgi:hypothetical protein